MALQTSGAISLNDIHVEAGGSSGSNCSINDTDIRGLINKSSGASMSWNEWYGASAVVTTTLQVGPRWVCSAGPARHPGWVWHDEMAYGSFSQTFSAAKFGDHPNGMTSARAATSNITRILYSGCYYPTTNYNSYGNKQDYVTSSTLSNSTNFGNLSGNRNGAVGISSDGKGIVCGGDNQVYPNQSSSTVLQSCEYVTISTTSSASSFGNLTMALKTPMSADGTQGRSLIAGGLQTSNSTTNRIQYFSTPSTGNATNAGYLTVSRHDGAGVSNGTRAVFMSGQYQSFGSFQSRMDYINISSTGNAYTHGNMSYARCCGFGASDGTSGLYGGGYSTTTWNSIDKINIASTGNSTYLNAFSQKRHNANAGSGNN